MKPENHMMDCQCINCIQQDFEQVLESRAESLKKAEALDAGWVRDMRGLLYDIAHVQGRPVSADDAREAIRRYPQLYRNPVSPKAWGAIFNSKLFERVGDKISTHPSNHGRRIGVYKLREEKA